MNVKIWPRSIENKTGYICMPAVKNLHKIDTPENIQKKHPDWKLVKCPICGEGCYESDMARKLRANGMAATCTNCAIKIGTKIIK